MKKNLTEIIKREIMNSEGLDWTDKLDALVLLDTASRTILTKDHVRIVMALEDLYEKVESQDHKDALLEAIGKYKREIRGSSWDITEEPVTLGDLLVSLGVPTDSLSQENLDLKLMVGMDDGMGYTSSGFHEVIDFYKDIDNGDIKLWV